MKKIIAIALTAIVVTVGIAFACIADTTKKSAKTRQNASAYLDQDGTTVTATVDLTGGYSCEFVRGAVYVYDQENKEGVPCVAMGITLDEEVYNDYLKESNEAKDCTKIKDGVMYSVDGRTTYICKVGENAYFGIFGEKVTSAQMIKLVNRISVTPEK